MEPKLNKKPHNFIPKVYHKVKYLLHKLLSHWVSLIVLVLGWKTILMLGIFWVVSQGSPLYVYGFNKIGMESRLMVFKNWPRAYFYFILLTWLRLKRLWIVIPCLTIVPSWFFSCGLKLSLLPTKFAWGFWFG